MKSLDRLALFIRDHCMMNLRMEPLDDEIIEFYTDDDLEELDAMEVDEIGAPDFIDDVEMLEKDLEDVVEDVEELVEDAKSLMATSDVPKKAVE